VTNNSDQVRVLLNALSDAGCALDSASVALIVRSGYKNLDPIEKILERAIESSNTLLQAYNLAESVLTSDPKFQDLRNSVFEIIKGLNAAAISLIAKSPTIESLEAASHNAAMNSATAFQTSVRFSDMIHQSS